MRSLIVIPTYNEKENIENTIFLILKSVDQNTDILVVDDNSPDGTGRLVDELIKNTPQLYCLHREAKLGLGKAYIGGFEWALSQKKNNIPVYENIIQMDADLSHKPQYIPLMLENLAKYDFVIGSRYTAGGGTLNWGLLRRIISKGGSIYARLFLNISISDCTGGFNGWHRRVLETIDLHSLLGANGYSFQIELKYRALLNNFRYTEFGIIFEDRKIGKSKMSSRIVLEALVRVIQFRFLKKSILGLKKNNL